MYTVTGDFDLQLRVVARNASELQDSSTALRRCRGSPEPPPRWPCASIFRAAPSRSSRLRQTGKINRF
ncbi:hypothetical protein [Arthrobacter sp. JCM 19049]|uniref:hypothetical protein n=1 Tax=Arthrobacter sp. JCM 19049 TaxID=1460643 RepID=UPI0024372C39|nr:hypothetical protein [Arthrobacter sp. JCM 19049]